MNQRRADFELLRSFVRAGDQQAFADVIHRHLDLVYATALRKVGDAGAAEEIAQNVFTILSRKAWRFAPDDSLPAWLYRTTLRECQSWLRGELRRRRREQTAAELGTTMKTPDEQYAFNALVPLLDEALLSLREKDRTALLLRFYESHSLRDVGAALGLGEDAAQKRVAGAVEKLAQFFQRRGFKTATVAATMMALRITTASASAATCSSLTSVALRTASPKVAGLAAVLSKLIGLTKVQKGVAFLTATTLFTVWVWSGRMKTNTVTAVTLSEAAQLYVEVTTEIDAHAGSRHDTWSATCIVGTNAYQIIVGNDGGTQWLFDESRHILAEKLVDLHTNSPAYKHYTIDIYPSKEGYTLGGFESSLPWLALCSGTYLKKPGRVIPLPAVSVLNAPDGFAYIDKTTTFKDGLGLPRSVDLYTSEVLLKSSILNGAFGGKHDVDFWKRGAMGYKFGGIPDGRLKFHYAATLMTNFMGWNFPIKFEFVGSRLTANDEWVSDWSGVGTITSLSPATKPTVESLSDGTSHTVVDYRFEDAHTGVTALFYQTTNSAVSTTNDPALQKKFTERVARAKRKP